MSVLRFRVILRMILTYHGGYFLKIQQGDTVIAANPFSKKSRWKSINFGARIALVSMNHPDMNGVEQVTYGEKVPFVIMGPGEYEIGGIVISGFPSPRPTGKDALLNTIYVIDLEGIRVVHLGALSSGDLGSELLEGIGDADIVVVPVAGGDVLRPADADKVAVLLGAKLVIPVAHEGASDAQLKVFLKESGAEDVEPLEKLTLKKKDLEGKEGEIVILQPISHA